MAEEFNLEQAVTEQEKAEGDREFYKAFIGQQHIASPLASYLYGAANAKYASMKGKLYAEKTQYERDRQAKEDADKAATKALNRRDAAQNQMLDIVKGIGKGDIEPTMGSHMLQMLIAQENLGTPGSYDQATGEFSYTPAGQEQSVSFNLVDLGKLQLKKDKEQAEIERKQASAEASYARAELAGAQKNLQEEKAKTEKEIRRGKVAKLPLEIRKLEAQGVLTEEKAFTEAAKRAIMMTPEEAHALYASKKDYSMAMAEAAKYNSQAAKARAEKALQSGNDNKFSDFYRVNKNLIEIARKENFLADIQNENDVPDNALVDFLNGYRKGYDLEGTLAIVLDEARRRGIDVSGFKIEEEKKDDSSSEKQKGGRVF